MLTKEEILKNEDLVNELILLNVQTACFSLKPCPFCGSTDVEFSEDDYNNNTLDCVCSASLRGGTKLELICRWNKRYTK